MLHEIQWPQDYLPGTTDNFASNEVIVQNLTAAEVFSTLLDTSLWNSYYKNASDVHFYNEAGPLLSPIPASPLRPSGSPLRRKSSNSLLPVRAARPSGLAWLG